jgi:hypothetical protein
MKRKREPGTRAKFVGIILVRWRFQKQSMEAPRMKREGDVHNSDLVVHIASHFLQDAALLHVACLVHRRLRLGLGGRLLPLGGTLRLDLRLEIYHVLGAHLHRAGGPTKVVHMPA